MNENQRIFIAFTKLGDFLREFCDSNAPQDVYKLNRREDAGLASPLKDGATALRVDWSQRLEETIALARHKNGWFTRENVLFALQSWSELLKKDALSAWLSTYDRPQNKEKTVAVIMAGNIPLVGFHDLLAVLITGNKALLKLSSNDNVLISFTK